MNVGVNTWDKHLLTARRMKPCELPEMERRISPGRIAGEDDGNRRGAQ